MLAYILKLSLVFTAVAVFLMILTNFIFCRDLMIYEDTEPNSEYLSSKNY